jgi:hypothetical protein
VPNNAYYKFLDKNLDMNSRRAVLSTVTTRGPPAAATLQPYYVMTNSLYEER